MAKFTRRAKNSRTRKAQRGGSTATTNLELTAQGLNDVASFIQSFLKGLDKTNADDKKQYILRMADPRRIKMLVMGLNNASEDLVKFLKAAAKEEDIDLFD